ncbi:MAG: phytanoyl-CoA dioxygenase family protein [Pseudomonadota bacterium]
MDSSQRAYLEAGEARAYMLGNRGPLRLDADGALAADIVEAYWTHGFYVFEGLVDEAATRQLVTELEAMLSRAPSGTGATTDAQGRPAIGLDYTLTSFRYARPLSDPNGGTASTHGRYPARMSEPEAPTDAPAEVPYHISGILHLLDSALYLYGHPKLLAAAATINGPDFVPFTDTIWVKPAGLGASVSWHQDGTTHWQSPDLDKGTHGFNFMTQFYDTNAENALWVMPGTHNQGKIDIRGMMAANPDGDRLPGAVPMLAKAGDVAMCNRQVLHGSFANTSPTPRATLIFGFHRRASVLGVQGWAKAPYDEERLRKRSEVIAMAIAARAQRYPDETPYPYVPFAGTPIAWQESHRQTRLANYNVNDIGI